VFASWEKATDLNPRDADWFFDLGGQTFDLVRRYADAVRAYDRALRLAPDLHGAAVYKGRANVRWHGQVEVLRDALDRLPSGAEAGEGLGDVAAQRAALLLLERNTDGLLQMPEVKRVTVFDGQDFFLPSALYAAWAHQLRGDHGAEWAAFNAARVRLDTAMKDLSGEWRVHAARGLALAGLGRRDEALREARWLQESAIDRADAFSGPLLSEDRARILAQAGDAEAALDEIERLLAKPSWLSVHTLRLDPRWDPIRNQPRFKALLAKCGS
jgi:tetratricopeptide (TPR) repeat protein